MTDDFDFDFQKSLHTFALQVRAMSRDSDRRRGRVLDARLRLLMPLFRDFTRLMRCATPEYASLEAKRYRQHFDRIDRVLELEAWCGCKFDTGLLRAEVLDVMLPIPLPGLPWWKWPVMSLKTYVLASLPDGVGEEVLNYSRWVYS